MIRGIQDEGEELMNRFWDVARIVANATAVTGGLEHTCALKTTGGLSCWGYGGDGELGNSGNSTSSTPATVVGFP